MEEGIHLENIRTSGRRLANYYTPLQKLGRATRPCIAEKGKLQTTLAFQRLETGKEVLLAAFLSFRVLVCLIFVFRLSKAKRSEHASCPYLP